MRGTWNTGLKPFGVPLLVNWTVLLWPLILWTIGWAHGLQVIVIITISLLFHEYSHVIAARSVGFVIQDVTIFFFGGAAKIISLLNIKPKHEAYIAAVGPLSSFVLAFLFFMLSMAIGSPSWWWLHNMILANIILGIFNTLPLYPMDGGRILRAGLSYKFGQTRGTTAAVWTTTILGSLLATLFTIFDRWDISIIIVFVIIIAWGEKAKLKQISIKE